MSRFRKPSPALLVALLALLLALSSSAGANPVAFVARAINGSSIARHSIPLSALSTAAVRRLQGARGATGPRGAAGLPGAAGATNVSVVSQSCTAPCTHAAVSCPAGAKATGGGGLVVGNELIYESRPTDDAASGWQVSGGAATPPATGQIIAYAVCASP